MSFGRGHSIISNHITRIYGELGCYPICVYIKSRIINYWSRMICYQEIKLSQVVILQKQKRKING